MQSIIIIIIIIALFNVGAKHSYATIKYDEANLSQLLKPTSKITKPDHNKIDKTTSSSCFNTRKWKSMTDATILAYCRMKQKTSQKKVI